MFSRRGITAASIPPGVQRNHEGNPMKEMGQLGNGGNPSSRCGAQTRAGFSCKRAPLVGRTRCRLHGGLSPGAPRSHKNGSYADGYWTIEAARERRWARELVKAFVVKESEK